MQLHYHYEERLCPMCNGVENELHALLEYTLFDDIRQTLLMKMLLNIMVFIVLLKRNNLN